MPTEIERKFLVSNASWKAYTSGTDYRQGYILTERKYAVRVRVVGENAFLTIKGRADKERPLSRSEFEYPIPLSDALSMLDELCEPEQIHKTRYKVPFAGHIWEIDEFHGENEGLIVAEIELGDEQEEYERPSWLGEEVSLDSRYSNAALARMPYKKWK